MICIDYKDTNDICRQNNALFVVMENGICYCSYHLVGNEEEWEVNPNDEVRRFSHPLKKSVRPNGAI